jgi:ketopantoate reductase
MRVLVFGAGVLGSLYAARWTEAGHDVTVLARGRRYEDIVEHGIVLVDFESDRRSTTPVRVVDRMPVDEPYDVCLVLVQKTQLAAALPDLAAHDRIPAFLFMVNNAEGPDRRGARGDDRPERGAVRPGARGRGGGADADRAASCGAAVGRRPEGDAPPHRGAEPAAGRTRHTRARPPAASAPEYTPAPRAPLRS